MIEKLTLDNGFRYVLVDVPSDIVYCRLRVNQGALHERGGEEGIAHPLEHNLAHGGPKKYTQSESDQFRSTVGEYGAKTGLLHSEYRIGVLPEDFHQGLGFLAESLLDPRFDDSRFEQEKQRVLAEIRDDFSDPKQKDKQDFLEAFYGKESPHIYSILGNKGVVSNATIDGLKSFHEVGYHPSSMQLVLIGNLPYDTNERIKELFTRNLGSRAKSIYLDSNSPLEKVTVLHKAAPDLLNLQNPDSSSAEIEIGFYAPPMTNTNHQLPLCILGKLLENRLFSRLSQNEGIAYEINSFYTGKENQGRIVIKSKVEAKQTQKAINLIFDEIGNLKLRGTKQEELSNLTRQARYNIARHSMSRDIGSILAEIDQGVTPIVRLQRLKDITTQKLQDEANAYLQSQDGKYVLMIRDPLRN